MQGKQVLNETLFVYNLSIETFVPENHILRKINQIVDLSFVRELTQDKYCSNNGRTSIDPELFFRLMIIKYIYGIESERRLCEDAHSHMGYRWFCRLSMQDSVPHHSSLTKIRDRLGEEPIEQFFDCIVKQCCQHGLVKGKRIITDGTLIKANASINSLEAINMIERHQEKVREKSDRNEPNQKRVQPKLSNKTHQSRTDPESTLAYKNGCSNGLKYKGHFSIDAEYGIILDPFISTGADHESKHYLNRLETIQHKHDITIEESVADRGYGTGTIISTLFERNIRPLIPLFHHSSGSAMPAGFIYDPTTDTIQCPTGNKLIATGKKDRYQRQRYKIKDASCLSCNALSQCGANFLKQKNKPRYVQLSDFQSDYNTINNHMKTPYFKAAIRERFYKIEGLFSEAKRLHGFQRAQFRGRKKMQIQAFFTASVLNIKKLVKFMSLNPSILDPITLIFFIFQRLTRYLAYLRPIFIHSSLFFFFL